MLVNYIQHLLNHIAAEGLKTSLRIKQLSTEVNIQFKRVPMDYKQSYLNQLPAYNFIFNKD
jgi:hypothetical protein